MQRRNFVRLAAISPFAEGLVMATSAPQRLLVQAYVWQQWAAARNKKLGEAIEDMFPAVRRAGYRHMELPSAFFAPDFRERTVALVKASGIDVPILYHGGAFHEPDAANKTIAEALDYAEFAKPLGVQMVNTNANPKPGGLSKSDAELATQATALNTFGEKLLSRGLRFELHSHAPEMAQNAREWRYMLTHTDPKLVSLCVDVHWIFRGGQDPYALLAEAGKRVASLHLRNSVDKIWSESFADGDVDYRRIAAILQKEEIKPDLVVELAYDKETHPARTLEADLRDSRVYAEQLFGVKA